jgi:hypothetical protein
MATNGHHAPSDSGHNRRTLLMFGGGYALGRGNDSPEASAPSVVPSPTATHTRSPKPTATETPSPSASASETPSPDPTAEPDGDTLPDGRYFVRLNTLEGGEAGAPTARYDLAYFLTGTAADSAAKDVGSKHRFPTATSS